jgi:AAA15 family ATPase/GTPase
VLEALDVSGVMPPEPVLAFDELDHSVHPLRVLKRLESALERSLNIVKPVASL